jgi:ubiquitin carboxyl-terminal hydrolase 35/38
LRKLSLLESPNYLLITLKRFSNDSSKNTRKVKYAAKLRLTEDMDKQALYSLQAVIVHEGKSSSSGHYYCVARRADKVRSALP